MGLSPGQETKIPRAGVGEKKKIVFGKVTEHKN